MGGDNVGKRGALGLGLLGEESDKGGSFGGEGGRMRKEKGGGVPAESR